MVWTYLAESAVSQKLWTAMSGQLPIVSLTPTQEPSYLAEWEQENYQLPLSGMMLQPSSELGTGAPEGQATWWSIEPNVGRVANGVPYRVDRLRALGNAVVPAQAREAFERLMGLK